MVSAIAALRDLAGVPRHEQLEALVLIAQARLSADPPGRFRDALGLEPGHRLCFELGENARDECEVDGAGPLQRSARELRFQVRHQQPQGRKHARTGRHQYGPHAEKARQRPTVQRARAAERQERELARIMAAFDRDEPDRADHVVVDDRKDAARGRIDAHAERLGDAPAHGAMRRLLIEGEAAAEQEGRQVPEHEMRVGDGRLVAAARVAGGSRIGAGALQDRRVSAPIAETRAIEPPPAPMVTRSTIGSPTGQPAT